MKISRTISTAVLSLMASTLVSAADYTVSGQYVGAIIGWGQGPNNKITNCLENGSYENFAHCGMNYADGNSCYGNNGSNTNNYTYHRS